jgi:zinc transport system substrate-binding protein
MVLIAALLLAGCAETDPGRNTGTDAGESFEIVVYTVNYPLKYFAERIGGDRVRVELPAPADVDPAFWSPDVETVAAYQGADLVLDNGAGYASWLDRVSLPSAAVVDTSKGFRDRFVTVDDAVVHAHGPEGEHSHGIAAFTIWLDPQLAVRQAGVVRDALAAIRPETAAEFEERYQALEADLLELDRTLEATVAGSDQPLMASHPVYQYLAGRYGLNLASVHFEPDEFPDAGAWRDLEARLTEHPARWMLWEDEPLPEAAAKLRDLGIESVVFNPCGNAPPVGDYLTVMNANATALSTVFSE